MEDEEWQDHLDDEGDDILDHEEELELIRGLVEEDQEVLDRMEMVDAHCAMLAEAKYAKAVRQMQEQHGESSVMNLIFAIERQTGWHMEIVISKSDIDDALFNNYGLYDDKAWDKVRNSDSWTSMTYDINYVARRHAREMVDNVAGVGAPTVKSQLRKKLFSLWKSIDLALM